MIRSRNENLSLESVIAWSPDEARSFFAYLDRIADDTGKADEEAAGSPKGARSLRTAFVA